MACVASLGPAMVSVDTMMCPHQCVNAECRRTSSGASFLMHLSETPTNSTTYRPRKV